MRRLGIRKNRGAAAVEFALILIPLLMILMGTIDWGWYFYVREVVANAVREGARHGAAYGAIGGQTAAELRANEYLTSLGLQSVDASGQPVARACTPAPAAGRCCVSINYAITPDGGSISGFLSQLMPPTARATATMEFEQ